jgi:DNA-binding transcriptional LysR family regulator
MELRGLRHLVTLARLCSYTKAADELGISQSALSRSIQAIERSAKVRLFDRDRGGVHLTTVGRELSERAAALLREARDLDRFLIRAANGEEGQVAFGMAPLPAVVLLATAIADGLNSAPAVRRSVAVRSAEALLQLLVAEKIEFLVCAEGLVPAGAPVKGLSLGWFPVTFVVRAGHPLLTSEDPAARDSYPLMMAAEFGSWRATSPGGPGSAKTPDVVIEDHSTLTRVTESSNAVWLSSSYAVTAELRDGRLSELPILPGEALRRFRMMMYCLDRRSLSPAALHLRDHFRGQIRALSNRVASPDAKQAARLQ